MHPHHALPLRTERPTATIRPTATQPIEASGSDYVETRDRLLASVPAGCEIVGAISTEKTSADAVTTLQQERITAGT